MPNFSVEVNTSTQGSCVELFGIKDIKNSQVCYCFHKRAVDFNAIKLYATVTKCLMVNW